MTGNWRRGLIVTGLLAAATTARGQAPVSPPSRPTPWAVDVTTSFTALDNGYGNWFGAGARVSYTSPRVSPFVDIGVQHRDFGSQSSIGVGSYVTLDSHNYIIVGVASAPSGSAVLFPKLRYDVGLYSDTRVVPGLVWGAGFTRLSFGGGSTGTIVSTGPIYYHGPMILSGSLRLNHDGVGGENSLSGEVGGQYGAQGKQWIGGRVGYGHEAYEILSTMPLSVHFTDASGSAFYQKWITTKTALLGRINYEHKLTAYQSIGFDLGYRVEF
ncbi:MAG TPA: YaiO family outer membrane beta-barrel protein [Gemmatimonadaceae bacterium]|jgi:YaiO family outer membrane protein